MAVVAAVETAKGVAFDQSAHVLAVFAGAGALGCHARRKALFIDAKAQFGSNFAGQLKGKAISVIELEGQFAVESAAALIFQSVQLTVEQLGALADGAIKALFFEAQHLLDGQAVFCQFGIGVAHHINHCGHQINEEGLFDANQATITSGAAQQTAQHITATVVGGQNAVSQHKAHTAQVVTDDF